MKYNLILLVILIIFFISFTPTFADNKIVTDIGIQKTLDSRMNNLDKLMLNNFVNSFYIRNRNLPKQTQIDNAIFIICSRVNYEKYQYNLGTALRTGKGNCQVYGIMLYLLLTKCGIDNNVIISDTHLWNIIEGKQRDLTIIDQFIPNLRR